MILTTAPPPPDADRARVLTGSKAAKQLSRGIGETCHCEEAKPTSQSQNVQNSTIMRLLLPSRNDKKYNSEQLTERRSDLLIRQKESNSDEGATKRLPRHSVKKQTAFTNTVPRNDVHVNHLLTYLPTNLLTSGKTKAAFTLAEVLIALTIIGVVAALTMPALIAKYQKKQTVTQLKKAYSEIYQAINLAQSEHGTIDTWDFSNVPAKDTYFGKKYLFPYIKIVKQCVPQTEECWSENVKSIAGVDSTLATGGSEVAFVTTSGYSVRYWLHGRGNGGWFWIDINGPKKGPNTLGIDVFPFLMAWGNAQTVGPSNSECTKNLGFYPVGLDCNSRQPTRDDLKNGSGRLNFPKMACKKDSALSDAGGYCGALIVFDGWEIKDDYPW